jgi:hypothetical protein
MYILLDLKTWEIDPVTDIKTVSEISGIGLFRLRKELNRSGKCFIDHYFIQQKDLNKSKRGRKN